jgi:hypothetical protein
LNAFRVVASFAYRLLTAMPSLGGPSPRKQYLASIAFAVNALPFFITRVKESFAEAALTRASGLSLVEVKRPAVRVLWLGAR